MILLQKNPVIIDFHSHYLEFLVTNSLVIYTFIPHPNPSSMKQLFIPALAIGLCLTACKGDNTNSGNAANNSKVQKNMDADRLITESFKSGDVSKLDNVVSVDFLDHRDYGDVKGRDSLKAMIQVIHNNLQDVKMETKDVAGNENYVYSWIRYKGKSDGSIGLPVGDFDISGVEVTRYNNGQAVEHWAFADQKDIDRTRQSSTGNDDMRDSAR